MTPQKTLSARAWTEMLLLAAIWGASFVSIRVALDEIGFATVVAHRVGWAALLLWIVVLARRLPVPRRPGIWGAFLVMGLLNNVLPFSLMAWGQLYIESGLTAIFNAATAIFGILMAALFFPDERLTPARLLGVGLGFLGVAIAIGLDAVRGFDLRSLAQMAVLAGTLCYALASVWARKTLTGLPPQVAAAGMLTGSTLIALPAAMLIDGVPSFSLAPQTWAAIGYFALIGTAGAYLLYYRVLAMAGSGNLMLVTLLIVPFAITLGTLLRHETLPASAYLGFCLLALGLLIVDGRVLRLIDRPARRG
ncbi:DMT family transporter [Aliishimia ponticola]|uniref:DMT family transporter n=1 Tax=Aliishimia ponticola TaxID=2499833 RepID=A0A4S4NI84_9RHOB|nr:DMT family transporter [Aliishimia ponticola]THH38417.1 DMT family transporter [Aliishimia ponticola]